MSEKKEVGFWDFKKESFKFGLMNLREFRPLAESSMQYLYADVANIKEYYINLGRHLNEFRNNKYYEDFGYATFEECISANLGMDKSSASRCISVWQQFGDKNRIQEKYKEYSYSQLVEMVSMRNPDVITPDMTIKQIRNKKKEIRLADSIEKTSKVVATSQLKNKPDRLKSICTNREHLLSLIGAGLKNIHYRYLNLFYDDNQDIDGKCIYLNVTKDLNNDLEIGKYKITLTKVKD